MPALIEFLEKQAEQKYYLCGGIVRKSFRILRFRYIESGVPRKYVVFHKHLEEQIDAQIERIRSMDAETLCENSQYILFGMDYDKAAPIEFELSAEKQNTLLSVPVKKSALFIILLLLLFAVGLYLKAVRPGTGDVTVNMVSSVLSTAFAAAFLFYLTGDLCDIAAGKGVYQGGTLYFTDRTKCKQILFAAGDILKWGILLGSAGISAAVWLLAGDIVLGIAVFTMWILGAAAYLYGIRFRRSYIALLIMAVLLAVFRFL